MSTSFETHHEAHLAEHDRDCRDLEGKVDGLGNLRLILAVSAILLLLAPLALRRGEPWWALIPVGFLFLWLGVQQDRRERALGAARAAKAYHERDLARPRERWRELSDDGADLLELPKTPADLVALRAADLDLFGQASLFQLVNRARTPAGRRTLARWLSGSDGEPPPKDQLLERQGAVVELRDQRELREALSVAAETQSSSPLEDQRLLAWAESPHSLPRPGLLGLLALLMPILTCMSILLGAVAILPREALLAVFTIHAVVLLATRSMAAERIDALVSPERTLPRYADLVAVVESAEMSSELGRKIRQRLSAEGRPASEQIQALGRLVEKLDYRLNLFFALTIGPLILWDLNLALRAEAWRSSAGSCLRDWLDALGELEALASLGALMEERPGMSMPELDDDAGVFDASGLFHPLIDRSVVVANDLSLGGPSSVLLLSGSNMSGKSTLLRSIGVAYTLALAGGPVPAKSLRLSRAIVVSSVRVVDSLARGASHFYAELERLKLTLDLARTHRERVVYLLDEILHGTNSRERFIGAVAAVSRLSEYGALGVVTTHDLSLTRVEKILPAGRVSNEHFGDEVAGRELAFDYRLRSGPVRSSNALSLMRAMGIEVDLEAASRLDPG
ncbi:MAG: DNA mismatch repair protein MutS [Deltaproteobacteria bacterium]|nr:DNA mismatch repair protein MutS [Deltaproteobacteria bacterium]